MKFAKKKKTPRKLLFKIVVEIPRTPPDPTETEPLPCAHLGEPHNCPKKLPQFSCFILILITNLNF